MTATGGKLQRAFVVLLLAAALVGAGSAVRAQESDPADERLLADGRVVYEANCQACHQADGMGLPGTFPPLVGNEHVADADYLRDVILNGRSGELVVNGETYDGVMPAFPSLSDEDIEAVIAYVQRGLGQPVAPPAEPEEGEAATGPSLPVGTIVSFGLAMLVALAAVLVVVGPVGLVRSPDHGFTAPQAALKTGAIVAYFIVATVWIPARVLESDLLASPPDIYLDLFSDDVWGVIRDLTGTGLWFVALAIGIWLLRRVQRDRVI